MNILKTHRISSLTKKNEISDILKRGKKFYVNKIGILFFLFDSSDTDLKTAILLKKTVGSAVKRNYIKRLYRNFVRENFTLMKNFNRVIFLYRGDANISFSQLSGYLKEALLRI